MIEGRNTRLDGRCLLHHNGRADCFCARYQAQYTFNRKRENHPHSDNAPKQNIYPFGSFFKQNRNAKTATTTQLADMLILTIFRKIRSCHFPLSDPVNHLLHFVKFVIR